MSAPATSKFPASIQTSLDRWHEMVAERDMSGIAEITHPDAIFRSPVAHTPYKSSMALCFALSSVAKLFDEFTYHREFATGDRNSVALEFSAKANGKELKGVDLIRFDNDGLITEFEVMVRPLNALTALGEEMGKRVGAKLSEFK